MKIYVVDTYVGSGPDDGEFDLFHRMLFHGRQQEKSYRLVDPMLGDAYAPLRVNRIGTRVPPVTAPTVNWVVSEPVRDALDGLGFAFEPVQFRKLVDFPWFPAGDFSYERSPEYQNAARKDLLKFFEHLPNVPALHKAVGPHYEMLVPRLEDVRAEHRSLKRVALTMRHCPPLRTDVRLSAALLEARPIVWHYHHILCERAFAALKPFLDRDFFEIVEADVA